MVNTLCKCIKPIDAKIYYEDGVPYMEYRGVTQDCCMDKFEVYFPKIKLEISEFSWTEDINDYPYSNNLEVTFADQNIAKLYGPRFNIIEKAMTKAQIEKELGYKIKIVD